MGGIMKNGLKHFKALNSKVKKARVKKALKVKPSCNPHMN